MPFDKSETDKIIYVGSKVILFGLCWLISDSHLKEVLSHFPKAFLTSTSYFLTLSNLFLLSELTVKLFWWKNYKLLFTDKPK